MKNIFLTSAIIAIMSYPAIALDANNHIQPSPETDCVESTLGTATGPANLEADWTANTINLEWYNEDTKLTVPTTSNTCTYDGGITLPSTNPEKTGYTFRGWQVREAAEPQCLSSNFNYNGSISGTAYTYVTGGGNGATYGLTGGEWALDYGNAGVVKGISKCANNSGGSRGNTGNPNGARGNSCWCQITGYDANKDKEYCSVDSAKWVYNKSYNSSTDCLDDCVADCAIYVQYDSGFRVALFGAQ